MVAEVVSKAMEFIPSDVLDASPGAKVVQTTEYDAEGNKVRNTHTQTHSDTLAHMRICSHTRTHIEAGVQRRRVIGAGV